MKHLHPQQGKEERRL